MTYNLHVCHMFDEISSVLGSTCKFLDSSLNAYLCHHVNNDSGKSQVVLGSVLEASLELFLRYRGHRLLTEIVGS